MSSVYVKLSPGAAVTWRSSVAAAVDLPPSSNQIGDVRAVVSTNELYMWNGSSWNLVSGGGGGGTPGGSSGTIQFNSGGAFAGDTQLEWDNTGKILNMNGLAIHSLSSSLTLNDNQVVPTTAFSYSASSYNFSIIEYSITRNTSKQVGTLFITNDASTCSINNEFVDLNSDSGITFSASISAGNVDVKYTSTSTGSSGLFRYSIRQWI